ncbi:MAG: glycosyltransferase family 2 protein [Acidobacteria bacterium]|nr:glycosyltransferase family 2 protein [Acidobacteriota bacterium]
MNRTDLSAKVLSFPTRKAADKAPLVSILMPAYKVDQYIGAALDSVFQQTCKDFEVIVINDGSPDLLEQVLEPYLERIVYIKQENAGQSAARNRAIEIARGRYLALLDPDDIWMPEYLSTQLAIMESDPSISVLYSDAWLFGDPLYEGKSYMQTCPSTGEVTLQKLITEECHVMISALMRRDVVLRVGLFDEALRSSEDFDLWVRIAAAGYRIAYHRQPLVYYRRRPESLSADNTSMCKSIIAVLQKLAQTNLAEAEAAAVQQRIAHYQALLRLYEGKRAFYQGDKKMAVAKLREANDFFRSPKLSLVLLLLRAAPKLLLRAYHYRNRWLLKSVNQVRLKQAR